MLVKSELIEAQIENVGALPTYGKKGRLVLLTTNGVIYRDNVTVWTPLSNDQVLVALAADGTDLDINWNLGNIFTKTISAPRPLTFSNTHTRFPVTVMITSSGTGAITWPAVSWPGKAVPTQTQTGLDYYTFTKVGGAILGWQSVDMG